MTRPTRTTVSSALSAWDSPVDANFTKLYSAPIPFHENAALTEANLQTTFAAAAYDRCVVWVNHTVLGYVLYYSDGTNWLQHGTERVSLRALSAGATQLATDKVVRYTGAGAVTFAFLAVASWKGQRVSFRNDAALAITLDPNGAELINGAATIALAAGTSVTVYNDGSALYTI